MFKLITSLFFLQVGTYAFAQVELQRTVIGASGHIYQSSSELVLISVTSQSSLIHAIETNNTRLNQGFIQPETRIEIKDHHFTVFPNPTTGKLTIHALTVDGELRLEVYNLDGKMVFDQTFSRQESYDWTDWVKGLYHIQLYKNQQFIGTKKILIK